jgi:hypothetical protein
MEENVAQLLSHVSNSGIVQLPGRAFPGIVMQGDSLSGAFDSVVRCLKDAKSRRDEDLYYEVFYLAQTLQGQLLHYEETLSAMGMKLPYTKSIKERLVQEDYDV